MPYFPETTNPFESFFTWEKVKMLWKRAHCHSFLMFFINKVDKCASIYNADLFVHRETYFFGWDTDFNIKLGIYWMGQQQPFIFYTHFHLFSYTNYIKSKYFLLHCCTFLLVSHTFFLHILQPIYTLLLF